MVSHCCNAMQQTQQTQPRLSNLPRRSGDDPANEGPMPRRSRLHIPRHHSRPGEEPDFSYLETSPAGAVARPDVNARVRDIGNLSIELVRVLDDAHLAVGQWHPHLDPPELQVGLRHMLLTRIFDERMQRV